MTVTGLSGITLVALTDAERAAFFEEGIYGDQQVRDAGWSPADVLARARDELTPVLDHGFAQGIAGGRDERRRRPTPEG